MKPEKYNNLLLISGTGRKTGKTTFACQLISEQREKEIVAIKITFHFHPQPEMEPLFEEVDKYQIFRETRILSSKDSSRMLAAGAKEVYYIQAKKGFSIEAFQKVLQLIPPDTPVLCESGGLRRHLLPGIHVVLERKVPQPGDKPIPDEPDFIIEMDGLGFSISSQNFYFFEGKWHSRLD